MVRPICGHGLVVAPPPGPLADLGRHRQAPPHQPPEQASHFGNGQRTQRLGSGGHLCCLRAFFVGPVEAPRQVRGAPSHTHAPRGRGGHDDTPRANSAPHRGRARPHLGRVRSFPQSPTACQPRGPFAPARCREGPIRQNKRPGWDHGCCAGRTTTVGTPLGGRPAGAVPSRTPARLDCRLHNSPAAMRGAQAARRPRRPTRVCAQSSSGMARSPPAPMRAAAPPATLASASHGRRLRRPCPTHTARPRPGHARSSAGPAAASWRRGSPQGPLPRRAGPNLGPTPAAETTPGRDMSARARSPRRATRRSDSAALAPRSPRTGGPPPRAWGPS